MKSFESLEPRRHFAVTPASVLTPAIRQTLLNDLTLSIKSTLQADLTSNNVAKFDTDLLNYMTSRPNSHFFFNPSDAGSIASYIIGNIGDGGTAARADNIYAHKFPVTGSNSTSSYVQQGATINWTAANATYPDALHVLNWQTYWVDLAEQTRYSGDNKYVTEMVSELAGWSAAYPTMAVPAAWSKTDQKSWVLDTGIRTEFQTFSYFQALGTSAWTKEANTLMLYKLDQQGQFLSTATSYGYADNRSIDQAKGLIYVGDAFPEFTKHTTWASSGRSLMYHCIDGQFFNDGTQVEEAPGYAANVLDDILGARQLDKVNGINWNSTYSTKVSNAINALYQQLTPDGKTPAIGDTYPALQTTLFLKSYLIQGVNVPQPKPRGSDVWLFGIAAVNPYLGNNNYPNLGTRPNTYALSDSGNYIFRSGSDPSSDQINFKNSPKGDAHGHFDSLSLMLTGGGNTLLADPGPYKYDSSATRAAAISTPAHNTVSLDGKNVGELTAGSDSFGVDKYTVDSNHVQITAHQDGYAYLDGSPEVSRSVWYNYNGVIVIVDWVNGSAAHAASQSFLLPGTTQTFNAAAGYIQSTNASGENVRVQSIKQTGQAVTTKTTGVFTSIQSGVATPARQMIVSQSGKFVCFATVITTFTGNTAPNVVAHLGSAPTANHSVTIGLTINGVAQTLSFTPPVPSVPDVNGTVSGSYSDIAYDSTGKLSMAFFDRDTQSLKFTQRTKSGAWGAIQTIDSGNLCGYDPSIAVDSQNHVGVSYTDAANGDLKYAYFDGDSWSVESVDVKGSTGHYSSLAFSRHDGATISYYDKTHGDLRLATDNGTAGWSIQTIDAGRTGSKDVGRFSSLKLDPSRPTATKWAIAYEDTGSLKYLYAIQGTVGGGLQQNGFTIFTAATAPKLGGYLSLAFDSSNRPGISYYDSNTTGLGLAHSAGSTLEPTVWSQSIVTQVGSVGAYSNLFYTGLNPTIFYFDRTHSRTARIVKVGTKATVTNLAAGGREIHVSRFGSTTAYSTDDEATGTVSVYFV